MTTYKKNISNIDILLGWNRC